MAAVSRRAPSTLTAGDKWPDQRHGEGSGCCRLPLAAQPIIRTSGELAFDHHNVGLLGHVVDGAWGADHVFQRDAHSPTPYPAPVLAGIGPEWVRCAAAISRWMPAQGSYSRNSGRIPR